MEPFVWYPYQYLWYSFLYLYNIIFADKKKKKSLGQNVSFLINGRNMKYLNLLLQNLFSNKEEIQFCMLSTRVHNRITGL